MRRWICLYFGMMVCAFGDASTHTEGGFEHADGKTIYETLCASCHMSGGEGVSTGIGMYPPLINNGNIVSYYVANIIFNGLRGMPELGSYLDDEGALAVTNYVVQTFSINKDGDVPLSLEEIKEIRKDAEE